MTHLHFEKTVPLSLYIHLPWCVQKCPYCDFNSHPLRNTLPEENYIECLLRDLSNDVANIDERPLASIFIGGGTPSLFSAQSIEKILKAVKNTWKGSIPEDLEITLEANPGTVEQTYFEGYLKAGVNRISLGIQSFQDAKLKALGRIHQSTEAHKAIKLVQNIGFPRFNIDLMYGLPSQTLIDAQYDLNQAIDTGTKHISWYHLTLEPNTFFYRNPPKRPENDELAKIQDMGDSLLKNRGFTHYEVSAYAKEADYCQHNLNYWEFGDYLGIGAGAHSKLTNTINGEIIRIEKIKHPTHYLAADKSFIAKQTQLSKTDIPFEFMLNVLRLQKAIPIELFNERCGMTFPETQETLQIAVQKQLLSINDKSFEPTPLGRRFLNDLMQCFLMTS